MATTQPPQSGPTAMPQPQPVMPQPVPYIESKQPNPSTHPRQRYKKVLFGLGIVEIVFGSIALILGIAAAALAGSRYGGYYYYYYYRYGCGAAASWSYISQGIWCGLFLLATGLLGILLAKKNLSRHMYIANMAMAIISAVIVFTGLVLSALAAAFAGSCDDGLVGMHVVIAIVCFAAMVIAILHASFCCTGVCYKDDIKKTKKLQYTGQQNMGYAQQPQIIQGPNGQLLLVTTPVPSATYQNALPAYPQIPVEEKMPDAGTRE